MQKCQQNSKKIMQALCWASAIIAAAILGASNFLTVILLPILALTAIGLTSNEHNKTAS